MNLNFKIIYPKNSDIFIQIIFPKKQSQGQSTFLQQSNNQRMDKSKQQLQPAKESNQIIVNEKEVDSSRLIYKNFATKSSQTFVGISIHKERLYIIQKKVMSIFQLFVSSQNQISQKAPVLIKEVFLPFEVSKYYISDKFVCVKAKDKSQIRDAQFQRIFYSERKGLLITRPKNADQESINSNGFTYDTVEELELDFQIVNDDMITWKVLIKKKSNSQDPRYLREYVSQKYNLFTQHRTIIKCKTELIDPTNKNRKSQICKPPIFINQLGYIQNFYLWPITSNDVQIGIFFNQKQNKNLTENALYQICSFHLKDTHIKNIFYYDFKGTNSSGKSKDGPHLFLAICESPTKDKSKVKIVIFEILPQQNINNNESQNESLNNYLDQFNQLRKQKKFQQSISNSILLNELLSNEDKSSFDSNLNKPTLVVESFTIKDSCSLKKVFYNPSSKVLWINDTSKLIYRIKLVQSGDFKEMKQKNVSFIQNIEGFVNGQNGPDLQGVMHDDYPIFKIKAINLQIGLREKINLNKKLQISQQIEQQRIEKLEKAIPDDSKEIIQFDDKELQKIEIQKSSQKIILTDKQGKQHDQKTKKQFKQIQIQTEENSEAIIQKENNSEYQDKYTQIQSDQIQDKYTQTQSDQIQDKYTQTQSDQIQEQQKQSHIQISNLSQLLKELNFNKVEDVLIRFSTLFSANVTKNVNKLKEFNNKAKEEIKLKINGDIFELIKQVFSSIMNQALSQKIQKEIGKSRDFVEKIFNKHLEHFNLMILQEKIKEENVKKLILQEQLRSIDVIKEASMKFLDVTKVREMQKIAYNEVVVQSIRQVGKKIENLQSKVDQMFHESQQVQKQIITDVKEIKETFKLLIDLEENLTQEEKNKNVDEQSSQSGFQSGEEDEESQEERNVSKKQGLEYKRIPPHQQFQPQHYPLVNPSHHGFNQRPPGWNPSFYPSHVNYSFPSNPSSLPPVPMTSHYPPVYPHFAPSYQPHQNPYESQIQYRQQQYFPPPYTVQPSFSEIRTGSQIIQDPVKAQKKKKLKSNRKNSASHRNQ